MSRPQQSFADCPGAGTHFRWPQDLESQSAIARYSANVSGLSAPVVTMQESGPSAFDGRR
jgi:hypothetical protein